VSLHGRKPDSPGRLPMPHQVDPMQGADEALSGLPLRECGRRDEESIAPKEIGACQVGKGVA